MTNYSEILRLTNQGISQRNIASSCRHSRNTVGTVIKRAQERNVSWPFDKESSNADLQEILFPEKNVSSNRRMPDCEYIHKEMVKSSVNLTLLWYEYCQEARLNNEIPFMYTQFCRYYHKYPVLKRRPCILNESLENRWKWIGQVPQHRFTTERLEKLLMLMSLWLLFLQVNMPM